MKVFSNEEVHESKKTEDSSNHNSNNLKDQNDIKSYLNKNNKKNNIDLNIKYSYNIDDIIRKKKDNSFLSQKPKKDRILKKQITIKKGIKNINKNNENLGNKNTIQPTVPKKKKSILENVSNGLKNVFNRSHSKNIKKK